MIGVRVGHKTTTNLEEKEQSESSENEFQSASNLRQTTVYAIMNTCMMYVCVREGCAESVRPRRSKEKITSPFIP